MTEKDGDEEQVSGSGQVGSTGSYSRPDCSWSTCVRGTGGTRMNTMRQVGLLPFTSACLPVPFAAAALHQLRVCSPLQEISRKRLQSYRSLVYDVSLDGVWLLPSKREKAESSWTGDISYFFQFGKKLL